MSETAYDLVIIGGGPGGYVAAIRAGQLGLKTACVEMRGRLGGTCLNVGCIPSKALLQSSHLYEEATSHLAAHGIGVAAPALDLGVMLARKDKVVDDLTRGIEFLFRKNKVDYIKGRGRIAGPGRIEVALEAGGNQSLTAKSICIATGSESSPLPGIPVDEKRIVTSTGALSLNPVPGHLIVIGAGYIGLEMGSVWRRLGSKVTVVEYLDRILPGMDGEIAKQFQRLLQKQGFEFHLGQKVTGAAAGADGVTLTMAPAAGGEATTIQADVVLLCVGRRAFTEGLGLETVGVAKDERGRVKTNGHFATNVPGIYAIGDVIAGPMLAHKAEEEGVALAEILAGQAGHVNYETVPGVVYTHPEVATVGKTEEELKAAGIAYNTGKFPFTANGRAKVNHTTDGFVKILADAKTDRVLGVHIVGADAGTMIAEAAVAMEFGAAAEDIARTCHAHPTLSEAVKEAALAVDKRAIHM
ncbi:MAG TPA: dihydrolipoyl dehydrogenase [Hypericibacter adhaerens]|uniref:dihydrolipoyl dehydrogenase n=1 Tax=Hypericibacter adhaerens TaxID=2602016 RepID=UPI002D07CCD2|nr:dihydrolipoyl dehydrogenase [Hypericibacter adhaerens]HWA45367.1 dihydrolipoyl dehydrogenase [Hypericibacter adhaerens]